MFRPDEIVGSEESSPPSEPVDGPERAPRKTAVARALAEAKITSDPKGQWAMTAEAGSAYGDAMDLAEAILWSQPRPTRPQ